MAKWKCTICSWVYDPAVGAQGIELGTAFEDLPDDFRCPTCGAMKKWFTPLE